MVKRKVYAEKKKNNDAEIVKESYNKNAQLEWERLEGFHFEFEIAKHYLKKYLRSEKISAWKNCFGHRRRSGQIQRVACQAGVRRDPCRSE